jgi:UDP-N-acetylglucosamine acyltransferase
MAPEIHPNALVHPKAELGRNVKIGPGAMIDEHCKIDDDCEIRAHAVITGRSQLGKKNQVGYGAIIGSEPQDLSFKGADSRVVIGDRNTIREYVTIHRGTKEKTETVIGDDNFLMTGVHVAHNCRVGSHVILVNNVLLAGYVTVADRAFLGGGSVVHQHCRIGELVMLKGLTCINRDVPPYILAIEASIAAGLNVVGMRRAGVSSGLRRSLQRAFHLLYRSGYNVTQALEKIEAELKGEEIKKLVQFIQGSKRGICIGDKNNMPSDLDIDP